MNSAANAAQQEYWNTVAGPRWVGLGGFVERRVRAVNDLLLTRSAVERALEADARSIGTSRLGAFIGGGSQCRRRAIGAPIALPRPPDLQVR
jgi:hypothetical protein